MLTYKYVDDGWYCQEFWIEDDDGSRFAMTDSEANAQLIVNLVNTARQAEITIQQTTLAGCPMAGKHTGMCPNCGFDPANSTK
jgi:hypothetical protein